MPAWVGPYVNYSLLGLESTLLMTIWSMLGSLVIGFALGPLLAVRGPIRTIVRGYVELWRGLPVLISIFVIYFGLPVVGIVIDAFASSVVALVLWGSANVAEIVRGAVQSIPASQFEAAGALGLNGWQRMVYVILPQAIRRMIPSIVGIVTTLVQATALASAIGVLELTESASRSIERVRDVTGDPHALLIMGVALIVYFLICFPLTQLSRHLEARLI